MSCQSYNMLDATSFPEAVNVAGQGLNILSTD